MATTPPAPPPPPSIPPTPPSNTPPALVPPPDPEPALRTKKLQLEIEQLQQQNSRGARIVEALKNWGTPFVTISTLVALVWTIHAGIVQMRQTQNAQDQNRFDKAITRLGNTSVKERQTGAAGLGLFLGPGQEQRHGPTLRFLASALVIEDDPTVRSAILDTFRHVDPEIVQQQARDEGLRTLIESDRAILGELRSRTTISGFVNDYLALGGSGETYAQKNALRAAAKGIAILITKRTGIRDFSNIYCENCDFSLSDASSDLTGADFTGAFLDHANFPGATLSGANFHNAALQGTNFRRATLRGANFSGTPSSDYVLTFLFENQERPEGPNFACSDLTGADFSGSLFFGVIESHDPKELVAGYPELTQADLTNADLSKIGFYALRLRDSKPAAVPFTSAQRSLETYRLKMPYGTYGLLELSPTADWTFSATSGPFLNSWRYLLSKLRSAKNVNTAALPSGFRNFETEGYPPFTPAAGTDPCQP
jgi:uncharacterized protein YjbI with pentapeptide repeats